MENYTKTELEEAVRAITSTIGKCEKAREKLAEGTPQKTLTDRRIKAFKIAVLLLEEKLEKET